MPRRPLLVLLAAVETATLLAGCRVALHEPRAAAATTATVAAPVAAAPAPLAVAVVTKPAPVRKAAPRVVPKPKKRRVVAVRQPVVRRTAVKQAPAPNRPLTGELLMLAAVAKLPGYRPGSTRWVITTRYGAWGVADWYRNTVYISPRVPADRMYDVVAHEWSHLVSVRPYPSVDAATKAMNRAFGGTGLTGAERAADCMARRLGARWTHYTSCSRTEWRAAAGRLLAGQPA